MINYSEILEKAGNEPLTKQEIQALVDEIERSKPGDDENLTKCIHALCFSGSKQYRKLIERFLYYPSFPMVSVLAFECLHDYWCYRTEYMKELKEFLRGVDWDQAEALQVSAIGNAGEYLSYAKEPELFRILASLYDSQDTDNTTRRLVYLAIGRAVGFDWKDLLEYPDREDVLNLARKRLEKELLEENNLKC